MVTGAEGYDAESIPREEYRYIQVRRPFSAPGFGFDSANTAIQDLVQAYADRLEGWFVFRFL